MFVKDNIIAICSDMNFVKNQLISKIYFTNELDF